MLSSLDASWRRLQIGEIVRKGDMLQIGPSYCLLDGSVWINHTIEHGGPFETVWTQRA